MKKYFTTIGDVRGSCNHKHRSVLTAARCLREDRKGCEKQGGYSDRTVTASDDSELSEDEIDVMDQVLCSYIR